MTRQYVARGTMTRQYVARNKAGWQYVAEDKIDRQHVGPEHTVMGRKHVAKEKIDGNVDS
jgi:hypothetical protein